MYLYSEIVDSWKNQKLHPLYLCLSNYSFTWQYILDNVDSVLHIQLTLKCAFTFAYICLCVCVCVCVSFYQPVFGSLIGDKLLMLSSVRHSGPVN